MVILARNFFFSTLLIVCFVISSNYVFADNTGSWSIKTNMPSPRAGNAVVEVDGKIYSIGGSSGSTPFNDVQVYDPNTNAWSTKSNMPTARAGSGAAVIQGKVYVIGGYTGNYYTWSGGVTVNAVEMYDPSTDTWTTKASMPSSLGATAAVAYNNKIYVFGGATNNINSVPTVQVYDPSNDTWTMKSDMTQPIHGSGAVVLNNRIYLVGGRYINGSTNVTLNSFQEYDPTSDTWTAKPNLSASRGAVSSTVFSGKIYAIAGVGNGIPAVETNTVEVYDINTNSWAPGPTLNNARSAFGAVTYNGNIYVVGGSKNNSTNATVASVEAFSDKPVTPINLSATGEKNEIMLKWSASEGATSYIVERSETTGGPYTTISDTVAGITYNDINVTSGKTYYYVVIAVNSIGQSGTSNEALAQLNTVDRAVLIVTLKNGAEKEFDLSMTEVNDFINWYETRKAGTGSASYAIDKHDNNKGPFKSRKDYVIFDKILTYKVNEYTPVQ